jgi:hypothetical protein
VFPILDYKLPKSGPKNQSKLQNCKIAKLQNCKIAKLQNCKKICSKLDPKLDQNLSEVDSKVQIWVREFSKTWPILPNIGQLLAKKWTKQLVKIAKLQNCKKICSKMDPKVDSKVQNWTK